ncbi:MAG: NADH-quinone oxidoreductase subunit F, partial [Candidatus Omnitrophota bacterium]
MTQPRPLSSNFETKDAWRMEVAEACGAYKTARAVLASKKPAEIIDAVIAANLRGLGGAGFSTGKKWRFLPANSTKPVYLVVNADEGEPGTFKDRYLIERDPHQLLEGILVSAYAIGAHKAYIYLRGEYALSHRRLARAIEEAYDKRYLGRGIFGTAFDLEVTLHRGAGAYICG